MQFLNRKGEFADAPRPDLVLLDLNMPRKDGHETLRDIKNDPLLKSIPVVVLTTTNSKAAVTGSYMEHANSYITKPVDIEQFMMTIAAINGYWFSVVKLPPKD
jgi:CheY-like chemotaxis protein